VHSKQQTRAWVEIAIGILSIVVGVLLTLFSVGAHASTRYVIWYGPVVGGIVLLVHAFVSLAGFRSFVAWRYLLNMRVRLSIPALAMFLLGIVVAGASSLWIHFATPKLGPFGTIPDGTRKLLLVLSFVRIGGAVFMGLAAFFGSLRARFTFFTTVPIGGVWIGTSALVMVLSVMSGFETDLREKILGSNAHIQITKEEGDFTEWETLKARIDKVPGVVASTPYAVSEVVIAAHNNGMPVIIKGIDAKSVSGVTDIVNDIEGGDSAAKLATMKLLEPIATLDHDLTVPQTAHDPNAEDPAPDDLPTAADPIDFSAKTGSGGPALAPDNGAPLDEDAPPSDFGGDANEVQNEVDPPPADFTHSYEIPQDFTKETIPSALDQARIDVVDMGSPELPLRTKALHGVLVGRELVKQTHLYTGEVVRIVSPLSDPSNPDATGTPIPFNRDYRVAGVFFTGMYEYDLKYVYVTLDSLQDFLDRGNAIDGIEVRCTSPDDSGRMKGILSAALNGTDEHGNPKQKPYRVVDWKELNQSLFSALKLEKIAMFLVLGIVILVASFSILGNLIMVVIEKQRQIALLKTLGASDFGIVHMFAIQGMMIGLIGTALGIATGLAACWAGKRFGLPLDPNVYYIDKLPIHVEVSSVFGAAIAGVVISLLATLYPAFLAARVRPAAGMRH
jgi:lipoprotein-releasing system permease protein